MFENQRFWFDTASIESMQEVIARKPGKVVNLIDSVFEVVTPWPHNGVILASGQRAYRDVWQVGTVGTVCHVLFTLDRGWEVYAEYLGPDDPVLLDDDAHHLEIPFQEFITHTRPLEAPQSGPKSPVMTEAANDERY